MRSWCKKLKSFSFKVVFNCIENYIAELISWLPLSKISQFSWHHSIDFPSLPPVEIIWLIVLIFSHVKIFSFFVFSSTLFFLIIWYLDNVLFVLPALNPLLASLPILFFDCLSSQKQETVSALKRILLSRSTSWRLLCSFMLIFPKLFIFELKLTINFFLQGEVQRFRLRLWLFLGWC